MTLKPPTNETMNQAIKNATVKLNKTPQLNAMNVTAGYIIPLGQKDGEQEGLAVIVRVVRFSEKKLKSNPGSGGLAE